jgi:hypothetical protein
VVVVGIMSQSRAEFTLERVNTEFQRPPQPCFHHHTSTIKPTWRAVSQDRAHHHLPPTDRQGDEADRLGDVTRTTTFETIETAVTDQEAAEASSGKKSAKMTVKEERRD